MAADYWPSIGGSQPPALVICAHGTDDPDGRETVREIAAQVTHRLPGVSVTTAYVDVESPALADEVDRLVESGCSVVVVPVLLTLGYHIEVDVAQAVARHPGKVVSTGPLGPDPLLVDVLVDRLHEAGANPTGPVVLGVAGSSRPEAAEVARMVADELAGRWAGPVSVGFLSACEPRLADAVTDAGRDGQPVAVATYLVGHGFFHTLLRAAGGDITAEPLGAHPRLIEVVLAQYSRGVESLHGFAAA